MAEKAQLLVEGKNDRHVIWALCQQHNVAETFSVEIPSEDDANSVEILLASIPVRLKASGLRALGIVLDADQNLKGRWQAIMQRLETAGYTELPDAPTPGGTVITAPAKPRVGVWLMPDNQAPGMLENFVMHLIPANDELSVKAEKILSEIEEENLNRYTLVHHPKAFIHTWLAWQNVPGQPMGQAITAHALNHNEALAHSFVEWLRVLFEQKP